MGTRKEYIEEGLKQESSWLEHVEAECLQKINEELLKAQEAYINLMRDRFKQFVIYGEDDKIS